MKRRIFIAINLPENIKDKLVRYQNELNDLLSRRNSNAYQGEEGPVRWTRKGNLHITLVFIGYVSDDETYEICQIIKKTAKPHHPFLINLERIILAPPTPIGKPPKLPRMLWVEGKESQELAKLRNDLENSLWNSEYSGYKRKESRAYKPHITLGRIKQGQWRKLVPQPKVEEIFNNSFSVETIEVMQSNLKRSGAEYSVLESVGLG